MSWHTCYLCVESIQRWRAAPVGVPLARLRERGGGRGEKCTHLNQNRSSGNAVLTASPECGSYLSAFPEASVTDCHERITMSFTLCGMGT